jgi:type I restriction enzyme S subunit
MEKELPTSWEEVPFTSVFDINGGTQPPKSTFKYEETEGYIRLLQIRDFGKKPVPTYVRDTGKLRTCEEDDILIARYGASIGRIVSGMTGAYNVALARVDIPNVIDKKYVFWLLNSSLFQKTITSFQRTAQNGFNKNDLAEIFIPIAPLPEQKRIVAKLDALFGHLDSVKTKLDRIPELLKNFRQQVLTQAVTGKLTEEWREGKGLDLNSSENEKFQIEFELLDNLEFPKSWTYSALGNYAQCSRGKFTARPRNDPQFFGGKFPFMQIGDLPREGGITSDYSKTLNEEGKKVSKSFPQGTIVIAIVGATIGNTGILSKEMYFPDSLIGINSGENQLNTYIEFFLRAIKLNLRQFSYAGGGQPNIKLPNIQCLGIGIPPKVELIEIVRRVEELFAFADSIESQYHSLKAKIDQLPQAILNKAFKGELVAQDAGDEPAGVLLERVIKKN